MSLRPSVTSPPATVGQDAVARRRETPQETGGPARSDGRALPPDWLLAVGLGIVLALASTVAVLIGTSAQSPGWQAMAELAAGHIAPLGSEAL